MCTYVYFTIYSTQYDHKSYDINGTDDYQLLHMQGSYLTVWRPSRAAITLRRLVCHQRHLANERLSRTF